MCRAPVLPLYARELGADPQTLGLVMGASTLTGVLLKLPAGALSDAMGRRTVLLVAAGLFALTPFAYPWTAGLGALIAIRFLHGSATALFSPTASAALSDLAPAGERGRWLGTYSAIQGSGQAAGPMLAGWLLGIVGYGWTFMTAGIFGSIAWFMLLRAPSRGEPRRVAWREMRDAVVAVARDHRVILTSLAQAGQFMLHGIVAAFLPVYAVEQIGLSPAQAGILFGAQMITTILSRPVFGRLSDQLGRRRMIVTGITLSAIAVALYAQATGFLVAVLLSMIYGAGLAITTSSTAALITDLSDRKRYGAAHGLFGTIFDVGDALGPIAGGFVAANVGYAALFRTAAGVALLVAVVFAVSSRRWMIRD